MPRPPHHVTTAPDRMTGGDLTPVRGLNRGSR